MDNNKYMREYICVKIYKLCVSRHWPVRPIERNKLKIYLRNARMQTLVFLRCNSIIITTY